MSSEHCAACVDQRGAGHMWTLQLTDQTNTEFGPNRTFIVLRDDVRVGAIESSPFKHGRTTSAWIIDPHRGPERIGVRGDIDQALTAIIEALSN